MKREHNRLNTLRIAVAVALGALSLSATALEIGEPNVRSALGERLLVEIPVQAQTPLPAGCVSAQIGPLGSSLRTPGQRQLPGGLVISTPRIVTEPMLELAVTVSCPGVARLSRSYTLFLNPATRDAARPPSVLPTRATRRSVPAPRAPEQRETPDLLTNARRYQVQTGDTVSAIAATLTPRGQSYWPVVDAIVAANPQAFIDNDPDRLVAGAVLRLPVSDTPTETASVETPASERAVTVEAAPVDAAPAAVAPAPVANTPAVTIAVATDAAPTRSQTDRLLNVVGEAAAGRASGADAGSPFADEPETPVDTASEPTAAAPLPDLIEATPQTSWTERLLGLGAGMLIALVVLTLWPRRKPPKRTGVDVDPVGAARTALPETKQLPRPTPARHRTPAAPAPNPSTPTPVAAPPPLTSELFQAPESVVDDSAGDFSFHTAEMKRPDLPVKHLSPKTTSADIQVGTLTSHEFEELAPDLDDQTQQMLEADYEAELTRTQQIEMETARRALESGGADEHDVTIEMHGYHESTESGDTVEMPLGETAGFHDATEARYVGQTDDTIAETDAMPTPDLDLDIQSASAILDASAQALRGSLDEDLDVDMEDRARKKQA
ncbi:MAG: hypothetical protein AAF350_00685 [Pseudomonadota bacterium]